MNLRNDTIAILDSLAAMGNYVEVADKNGIYVYCSKNCTYDSDTAEELLGRHITEAFDLTDETSVLLAAIKEGKPQRDIFMRYVSRKTGCEHYWLYNAFPLIINESIEGAVALYKEVEAIKNLIQEWNYLPAETKKKRGDMLNKKTGLFTFQDIIAKNEKMLRAIELSKKISKRESSVLITGETGTGKELFAQSIHSYSSKKTSSFVAVNCAAIPASLLESILFGVSKGAYTGAVEKRGLFEESSEGTIFLDELQSLDPVLQTKLLRVIETKTIRRVGGSRDIAINLRIISAINVNPRELIAKGQLKPDLFYRLAVITIDIPPLRDRLEDIPLLVKNFIYNNNLKLNSNVRCCSPEVIDLFSNYSWPGNVRELRHTIEYAMNIMDEGETCIHKHHLPSHMQEIELTTKTENDSSPYLSKKYTIGDYKQIHQQALDEFNDYFNKEFLRQALNECQWNISKTARTINISRQHLYELINKYNLNNI